MAYTSAVTSSPLLQTLMTQAEAAGQAKGTRATTHSAAAGQDRAELSTAASALTQSQGEDAVRSEKLRSIQAVIASGSYAVPAAAVADKLVQHLLG